MVDTLISFHVLYQTPEYSLYRRHMWAIDPILQMRKRGLKEVKDFLSQRMSFFLPPPQLPKPGHSS